MPRRGNGPVGIWAYEADSVLIEQCIAYRNKTSKGGEDGGGFDLDGGVTNSVIQYCLSYENQGSGFGIFQYDDATPWSNNIIRFNISENDGLVSTAHAGAYIWNGSKQKERFTNLYFYNNVIYNDRGAVLNFNEDSRHDNFVFANNIFVAKDSLVKGIYTSDQFCGNAWWSILKGFSINSYRRFADWVSATGQERLKNATVGKNSKPVFKGGAVLPTEPSQLLQFDKYRLLNKMQFQNTGVDVPGSLGVATGSKDFNLQPLKQIGIGAIL
jgi:hypothetical protein